MSVPRPAMLVEIVTAPKRPAWATSSASRSWCFAFSTSWRMPRFWIRAESFSEFSIEMVPTRMGCPVSWRRFTSSTMASNFSFWLL
jgi:hypothetical protein